MEIHVLDEGTIDKIAAGEVVERPASVVKELVENAMDSGADAVTVEIRDGGTSLIRVTDNGKGIPKEQVSKAFFRHATSKITSAEDLQSLSSLGFRGEALSSICAVSQVEMITKTEGELTGLRYVIEGSREKEKEEIGAPCGTTILVRNLFYNVPARKKFLKASQTEGGYITDLMEHLAMSHPEVSFKYVVNGQIKFHTSGNGNLKEIIYRIYGREIANELILLETEEDGKKISGYIGTPIIGRANRNFEHYFINGRYIKSSVIAKAAEEAYKGHLMQHKYPFFVLHMALDAGSMDVNVHPSKMEVRFHETAAISDFVYRSIHDTLCKKEMLKQITFEEKPVSKKEDHIPKEYIPEPFETKARMLIAEEPVYDRTFDAAVPDVIEIPNEEDIQDAADMPDIQKMPDMPKAKEPVQMNLFEEKIISQDFRDEYKILGQVFDTYWIVRFRDKLLFIDQHAAHEKVKYERLCEQIQKNKVMTQQINPPVILTLSGKEETVYRSHEAYFQKIGFEIEHFGGNEYAVRGIPSDLFGRNAKELFEEILDELCEGALRGEPEVIAQKLASMSCKAAVKGNHAMSFSEAQALIDELLALENPYHCPHGRPTIITMSKYELEKKFSRIV